MQGNTEENKIYMDEASTYVIRKALMTWYNEEESMDLDILQKKYDDIPGKNKECLNSWDLDICYINQNMEKCSAGTKTNIEIISHIMNSILKAYSLIMAMVRNMTHMGHNLIKKVINMYMDYWKSNLMHLYYSERSLPKPVEALVIMSDGPKSKTQWK
jgi:hypothetical protein